MTEAPDSIDKAIEAVEAEEGADRVVRADLKLTNGKRLVIIAPHPFTADEFESAVVTLLQMRAASEAREEQEKPIVVPPKPALVSVDGRPLR